MRYQPAPGALNDPTVDAMLSDEEGRAAVWRANQAGIAAGRRRAAAALAGNVAARRRLAERWEGLGEALEDAREVRRG